MPQVQALNDIVGKRGENIVELVLTDYSAEKRMLFRPGFLGDKWPGVDFYVEVLHSPSSIPCLFAQTKSTSRPFRPSARDIRIHVTARQIRALRSRPGPTYLFAVHEPTKRVFVKAIHAKTRVTTIAKVPLVNELTPHRLRDLYDEVVAFWRSHPRKPSKSVFL